MVSGTLRFSTPKCKRAQTSRFELNFRLVQLVHCELIHSSCNGPFEKFIPTTTKTPDDGMCGVPMHVGELITCEKYVP